jgi:hypothetical protein
MIGLSVTVSGADVASGLSGNLEECALCLYELSRRMTHEEREELGEYVSSMTREEKALVLALATVLREAARA